MERQTFNTCMCIDHLEINMLSDKKTIIFYDSNTLFNELQTAFEDKITILNQVQPMDKYHSFIVKRVVILLKTVIKMIRSQKMTHGTYLSINKNETIIRTYKQLLVYTYSPTNPLVVILQACERLLYDYRRFVHMHLQP